MTTQWQYLEQRPHPWRKQLYIKGKRLKAFTVWMDMLVNNLTPQEVAENKDIPLEAVMEALEYCQNNSELLKAEAIEVRRRLEEKGYNLEPQVTHR
ncbi:MAG: hypothetical protein QNJ54_27265 [Prochloraceae cyanobacterium]|nr:hypothetical protein [Prochloraceae cyanobacterium]